MYKYVSDAYNLYYFIQTSDFSQEIVKKKQHKNEQIGSTLTPLSQ